MRVRRLSARQRGLAAASLWVAAIAVVTLPDPLVGVSSWLDAGWQIGLDLAHRLHIPVGSQLFFSYGPYGFLIAHTPFYTQQWFEAMALGVAVHVGLLVTVAIVLFRRAAHWSLWLVVGAALVLGLVAIANIDSEGALLAGFLGYLAIDIRDPRRAALCGGLCGAVLGLIVLVKVTAVPVVVGVLIITVVAALAGRRRAAAAAVVGGFIVFGAGLWLAAGLPATAVPTYVQAALNEGSGFSQAMYTFALTPAIVLAGAIVAAAFVSAVVLLIRRQRVSGVWLLLVTVLLFASFKETFVRDGVERDAAFFGTLAILGALSVAVIAPDPRGWKRRSRLPATVLLAGIIALGISWRATDVSGVAGVGNRLSGYGTLVGAVVHSSNRHALQDQVLGQAQEFYRGFLAAMPPIPTGASFDVMPWDIGIVYADDSLHWDPRPVLQSYAAYTPWLEQRDAAFLSSSRAPDYLLYRNISVDDRYPAFDEPATFRSLLDHYRVVKDLGPTAVLLQRIPGAADLAESPAGQTCAPLGKPVAIPQLRDRRVYARVTVKITLPGRVLDTLAKTAAVRITLDTPAGSYEHRLVPSVAADGLYVSSYLPTTDDFSFALAGSQGYPITALTVTAPDWSWSSPYCVTFTSTPLRAAG